MNLSVKSRETIDACRFCWMCRHICPIGRATGQERNTSRARALALSMVERGAENLGDVAENLYECAFCNACTQDCLTGWDPPAFTLEARSEAALAGVLPAAVAALVQRCLQWGNPFAEALPGRVAEAVAANAGKADTLLYLGENARYKSERSALSAVELLQKTGVAFTVLREEPASGYSLRFLTGETEEAVQQYRACAAALSSYARVIVLDGCDLLAMKRYYKEAGVGLQAGIVGFWEFLAGQLAAGTVRVSKTKKQYTLQESCVLARDLEENGARAVASALGSPRDMLLHGKECVFAGSLLMNEYIPQTMACVAARRIEDAANVGAETLLVCDSAEYELLRANNDTKIKVRGLAEAVLEAIK